MAYASFLCNRENLNNGYALSRYVPENIITTYQYTVRKNTCTAAIWTYSLIQSRQENVISYRVPELSRVLCCQTVSTIGDASHKPGGGLSLIIISTFYTGPQFVNQSKLIKCRMSHSVSLNESLLFDERRMCGVQTACRRSLGANVTTPEGERARFRSQSVRYPTL